MDANGNDNIEAPEKRRYVKRNRAQDSTRMRIEVSDMEIDRHFREMETREMETQDFENRDLEFVYDDSDSPLNEIAELYSYTEQPEFQLNVKAFEDLMEEAQLSPSWHKLDKDKQKSLILKWLDLLEMSKSESRMRAARCFLYLAQGCWAEQQSDEEQQRATRYNVMLLNECGVFFAFVDLLNINIENSVASISAQSKLAVSLADSTDLRVILSVLYIIVEVMRLSLNDSDENYKKQAEQFHSDLAHSSGEDVLSVQLLSMVTRFCSGSAPHFPMKKVLLLLWKVILLTLGGMSVLKKLKSEYRKDAGLPIIEEDTIEIAQSMRPSSPPASANDLIAAQDNQQSKRRFRRNLMKQGSLDVTFALDFETSEQSEQDDRDMEDKYKYNTPRTPSPIVSDPEPEPEPELKVKGLPWMPKVRAKDLDNFLDNTRMKFVGFPLHGDRDTLIGLPEPIHEGVAVLKQHMYTSLAELQIQKEEVMAKSPFSVQEPDVPLTPAEILYQAMLPNLPQYVIALLKILLAAAPTSKAKTDTINIMADVLPEEMPMTVVQSMKLGTDVNRHKEIIVKAVSGILLLLLKHFKINHVYQFEFMSQHLVFANCIPLVLKFFNQNIMAYVRAKNVIPILDFPACVIGEQPELTVESLEIGDNQPYSWRNVFSCVNLLRILNKLTKWKHSRIMMLVVFKSAPILKRTLKVRHAMMQLYVLKLLKMQTKYLGRQWRKSNMKTMSAIYSKVRHRLNDDWAFGNDLDARPWDFQAEECALRGNVDRFNNRRYGNGPDSELKSTVDTSIQSVLGQDIELTEEFKQHYEVWLHQVLSVNVNWDELIDKSYL
ncbi:Striatin-interacting protein 1-like protein [Frankliniella fusca]|uniref:Striatin-interacting protein 1-like protein n=1 Tax=Frankliniella fusca TaxID=407009 RepID=A0AAE1LS93_9NEOP|nr:Striatin-interacting protein 1-like protein [Frankliniella fusca]